MLLSFIRQASTLCLSSTQKGTEQREKSRNSEKKSRRKNEEKGSGGFRGEEKEERQTHGVENGLGRVNKHPDKL
jgi:hypothetical protein